MPSTFCGTRLHPFAALTTLNHMMKGLVTALLVALTLALGALEIVAR